MLTEAVFRQILERIPSLTVAVLGDLFLDRYLDIDASLKEPSIETGLDAYQVVRVRPSPGAAGTVINNLVALGVGRVWPVAVIGDDGEGYELRQALGRTKTVDARWIFGRSDRRTPTYTKPMLCQLGQPPRELNRLDIKNRAPLPPEAEDLLLRALDEIWPRVDAVVVLDQVSEADCGVVTARVRDRLAELGERDLDKFILADSRQRIGLFHGVSLKPNRHECLKAVGGSSFEVPSVPQMVSQLARQVGRPVFCTAGEAGIYVAEPHGAPGQAAFVPAYPVEGPIDIVGAGDSTSAGIACAIAGGAGLKAAAAFGNLVASITIQQIGTTGTATPEQVWQRWYKVSKPGQGSEISRTS